jgi:hypothetical protein
MALRDAGKFSEHIAVRQLTISFFSAQRLNKKPTVDDKVPNISLYVVESHCEEHERGLITVCMRRDYATVFDESLEAVAPRARAN